MSKSRGNIVRAEPIRQVMGADALRYFLLREIVFGQDGSFSYDALIGRYNSDLANGLGNLASRTLTMIHQYRGGEIPEGSDPEIAALANETVAAVQKYFDALRILQGPGSRLGADLRGRQVHRAEGALEAGPADRPGRAGRVERHALHRRRERCASPPRCSSPVLPQSAPKIWAQLGMPEPIDAVRFETLEWGALQPGQKIGEIAAVFPRIEVKEAVEKMRELEETGHRRTERAAGQERRQPAARSRERPRSPSTISSRSICASAWCSPPSASRAPTS